jgi:murein tripeptide amidase MpaA
MKSATLILASLLLVAGHSAAQQDRDAWLTGYERSGFRETPRYAETMEYCRRLEHASPWIRVSRFGISPEGRELPLVIAAKDGSFDPKSAAKSGKVIVLIQNGIHAGEIDGKDACLMLLREIAITKTKETLLDHAVILIIPIYNVDGHERFGKFNRINQLGPEEMGWRVTAQNLNLNRDYLKADAPETQAWLRLFTEWLPDFFVDCHVTDGADFQHAITYGVETHEMLAQPVRSWMREHYLPVLAHLSSSGVPFMPYIFFRDDLDPMKGLQGGTAPPRFSTQYVAIQNRPALLIETHMLKDYRTRVQGTYDLLEATLNVVNEHSASLRAAVRAADETTIRGLERPFPLQFESVDAPNQIVHFMGYKQRNTPSELSGGTWVSYLREPFEADLPRYDSVRVSVAVMPPLAYLVPPEWQEVINRLSLHGLRMERLTRETTLEVEQYRFSHPLWQQAPFEGRHPVTYTTTPFTRTATFRPGTVVVRLNQRAARVAIHALEPQAPDAFAAWGFFDAVFEQKEYAEQYVMEPIAREMLSKDPQLKREFEARLAADSLFAKNPAARLNFFYERSAYWDNHVNLYPVARLLNDVPLATEPLR